MPRSPLAPNLPRRALLKLSVGLTSLLAASRALGGEGFRIVAHPQNPASSVSREFLADAMLKKASRWQDGEPIQAVDQRSDAASRRSFSEGVLKRTVASVRTYWQQRIFSGRGVPPPELESDAAVLAYVASHRGAVGYVSDAAKVDAVKLLMVR